MSLRCSLLGHDYGDAEIEREREEQGSEVVVTVREFEECDRCGKRSVISENKEVTALGSPAPDLESAESSELVDSSAQADSSVAGAAVDAAEGDDAEIMTDSTESAGSSRSDQPSATSQSAQSNTSGQSDESSDAETPSEPAAATAGSDAEAGQAAADDDGVILDDEGNEPSDGERRPGEWPTAETTHPAEADEGDHAPWPEVGQEDEGFDAEPGGGSADVEFGGGLTPESAPEVESDEEEVEFVNAEGDRLEAPDSGRSDPSPELSSGISAGAEAPSLSGPSDDPDVDAEFVCPECDYREGVAGSSLRAGDICPECARGYLAQE